MKNHTAAGLPASGARARALAALLAALPILAAGPALAQDAAPGDSVRAPRPQGRAVRIERAAPVLDGRLGDSVWAAAPVMSGFVQRQPREGEPATDRTEVRILYDESALYVGARMVSAKPDEIQAPISRRDNGAQAEHLLVSLDSYMDRRTAYTFGVTAAGTRLEWYHPGDAEGNTDVSFDPVWQAAVARDSAGWTAEMRIPFSQLRFNPGATDAWGLNLSRWNPATQEESFWSPLRQQGQGWSSRMGLLEGITGVRPSRRVEILPYVATGGRFTGSPGAGNPFDDGSTFDTRVGGDLKMGIGSGLTLEATVNPDFGQVEQDPAEVNLTAFETFFPERRPFFLEGSQLLSGGGMNYFYSRRVGAAPVGFADGDFVDYPRNSTILGAGKLTGRLRSGTSLAMLAALTGTEHARVFDGTTEEFGRVRVAAPAAYGVVRAQQEFGRDASVVGVKLTGVQRDLEDGSPLAALLHRRAVAGGADWNLRFRGGQYSVTGHAGFSMVSGDSLALLRTQRSSARYFQRPDASHVRLDPSRTSLSGFAGSLAVARNSGKHWLWELFGSAQSPGFDINDAGLESTVDDLNSYASLKYRETRPGRHLQRWDVTASAENNFNFGGVRNYSLLRTDVNLTLKNFWRTVLIGWIEPPALSDNLTRGGPLLETGRFWRLATAIVSPRGRSTGVVTQIDVGGSDTGSELFRIYSDVSIRPGPRWQLGIVPSYRRETVPRQYVANLPNGPAATFDRRYVFAFIDRSTVSAAVRLNYLFTPDLSLQVYAEPFAASGRYDNFGELPAARSRGLNFFADEQVLSCVGDAASTAACEGKRGRHYLLAPGADPVSLSRDFQAYSFRSNTVLRWEWRPGSTLFLVWQQDRSSEETLGSPLGPGALAETLRAEGDNFLALKVSFWLPVR